MVSWRSIRTRRVQPQRPANDDPHPFAVREDAGEVGGHTDVQHAKNGLFVMMYV